MEEAFERTIRVDFYAVFEGLWKDNMNSYFKDFETFKRLIDVDFNITFRGFRKDKGHGIFLK